MQIFKKPEFCEGADNVYRTANYIVKQIVWIEGVGAGETRAFSKDTFYKRTKARDKEFEIMFEHRDELNGKRLPSTCYSRVYKK